MNIDNTRYPKGWRYVLTRAVLVVCFGVGFGLLTVVSGNAMTLDDAVELSLQNNPDLQKISWNQHLSREETTRLKSQDWGQLRAVSSYTHYNLPRTLVPLTPTSIGSSLGGIATTEDIFTAALVYEVDLFNGFNKTRSIEISGLQQDMAVAELKLSREQLIYNVRTLYVNILSLQAQEGAQQAYVDALQRLTDNVSLKYRLGKLAKIDALKAEADLKSGKGQLDRIAANISILRGTLSSLLGGTEIGEVEDVGLPSLPLVEVSADFSGQISELQQVQNARREVEKSRKLVERESAVLYPRIVLSTSYGLNFGPNDSSNTNSGDWETETVWQAGINLQWNIFDFGSSHSKIRKAQIVERQSRYAQTKVELELQRSLKEAVTKINSALIDYNTSQTEVTLTREMEKIEQVRYEQGATDINDLLYTKARNLLAESRFISADYNYKLAYFYLDYLLERGDN